MTTALAWDYFTFNVADVFVPALINGDQTGLDANDKRALDDFLADARRLLRQYNPVSFHWSADSNNTPEFYQCNVSHLDAMCVPVRLNFYFAE